MKKDAIQLAEQIVSCKNLVSDIEYDDFLNSFNDLKLISKNQIHCPKLLITKLFEVFKSESDDFGTLTDVCFYIFEFEIENVLNKNDFINILFSEFEMLIDNHRDWVETFITCSFQIKFLNEIKRSLTKTK